MATKITLEQRTDLVNLDTELGNTIYSFQTDARWDDDDAIQGLLDVMDDLQARITDIQEQQELLT